MKKLDNSHCVVCGSIQIEGGSFEVDSKQTCYQEMTCSDCGSTWNDFYRLTAQQDVEPGPGHDEEG